jgi:4'-phosphopantetheinyl transferase
MGHKHCSKVSELLRDGWAGPEMSRRLLPNEVQVWRLDLGCAAVADWVEAGWDLLSPEEAVRASRMRAGNARDEAVAGRAALRRLLADELDCDARELRFLTGEHGKPSLGFGGIDFNVAHAQGMVLIALSRAGAVGVDVEEMTRPVEALEVAHAAFHPAELRLIEQASSDEQAELFYRCWTRREAIAKADGRGLMLPPESFSVMEPTGGVIQETLRGIPEVNLCADAPATCRHPVRPRVKFAADVPIVSKYALRNFHLFDLNPGKRFVAALAVSRRLCSMAQFDLYPARDLRRGITPSITRVSAFV